MKLYITAAVVSLIGLADAIYLTVEHVTGQSVRCTIVAGCSEVLSSQYAVVAGMPLAAIGAAAYFTVFSLATLGAFGYRIAGRLMQSLVLLMFLISAWLFYLQAYVINAFFKYFMLSAADTTAMTIIILFIRRRTARLS
jgi:uncharacterized membrane protein